MASVVASIFTTIPLFNPLEGYEPKATISKSFDSLYFPTIQTTLEVPISSPTIKFEFFTLLAILNCSSVFISNVYDTRIFSNLEQIIHSILKILKLCFCQILTKLY